ncbi:MAG: MFS transporter [Gammaproteobacteria bacterium]|nr:MFS transporter [Gammaproteobacteria bacterium]
MQEQTPALQDQLPAARFDLRPLLLCNLTATIAMAAFGALIGPIARTLGLAPWQAGTAVTVAGLLWLLLARAWGIASDRHGRRRILLLGSAGVALSYAALSLFIGMALQLLPAALITFTVLLIGRALVGAFYAALPAAGHALIADQVAPGQRAGAIASLGAANALGMVIGPALAAWLSQYSLALPLYMLSLLPLLGSVLLWRFMPPLLQPAAKPQLPPRLADHRLRQPLLIAFLAMFCVSISQITVGFFALDQLNLAPAEAARVAGIALTLVGIALIASQLLVRHLGWPPLKLLRIGAWGAAAGFLAVCGVAHDWQLWLAFFVAAAGMGWIFPAFSAWAADAVEPHEQGAAAGSLGAAQGLGLVLGPLTGSLIYSADPHLPYLVISLLLLVTALWLTQLRTEPQAQRPAD